MLGRRATGAGGGENVVADDREEMDRLQEEVSRMQTWAEELEEKTKLLQGHNEASGLKVMKLEDEREEWKSVKERVAIIEGKGGTDRKLLDPKDMKPSVLRKQEEWKKWKEEVWDYCGAVEYGMKEVLEEVMS